MRTRQATQGITELTAALIHAISRPEFPQKVLEYTKHFTVVDHFSLFVYGPTLEPLIIESASSWKPKQLDQVEETYKKQDYLFDPVLDRIKSGYLPDYSHDFVRVYTEDLVRSNHPWAPGYTERKHAERVSQLHQMASAWYLISYYRSTVSGTFRTPDLERLAQAVAVVKPAVEQHLASPIATELKFGRRPSTVWMEQLLAKTGKTLSPREIEVSARALLGMTRKGISLDLKISESTVNTLKKRCYAKLNISSLNQLFALCLRQLAVG